MDDSRFNVTGTLGNGFCGVVLSAEDKVNQRAVAIKTLDRELYEHHNLKFPPDEVLVMKKISHPAICKLHEVIDHGSRLLLILEAVGGSDLFEHLQQEEYLDESRALAFFSQIAGAVAYLHQQCIVHRDIKPENCVVGSMDQIKLIDFGLAAEFVPGVLLDEYCGSLEYAAPEVCSQVPYDGPRTDVWSLGVLLFEMLTGMLPFTGKDGDDEVNPQVHSLTWPDDVDVSAATRDIVRNLLRIIDAERTLLPVLVLHLHSQGFYEGPFQKVSVVSESEEMRAVLLSMLYGCGFTGITSVDSGPFDYVVLHDDSLARMSQFPRSAIIVVGESESADIVISKKPLRGTALKLALEDAITAQCFSPVKLLIADDVATNCLFFLALVQQLAPGSVVHTVSDGVEAVEAAKQNQYDFILMDLSMPVMSGIEATSKIREFDSSVPIVAFTVVDDKAVKLTHVGMNDVVKKPCDRTQLRRLLLKYHPENHKYDNFHETPKDENMQLPLSARPGLRFSVLDVELIAAALESLPYETTCEVWRLWESNSAELIDQLFSDINVGRMADAKQSLHALQGVSAQVGAVSVAKYCIELKDEIEAGRCITEPQVAKLKQFRHKTILLRRNGT